MPFYATINVQIFGQICELDGQQATYIPPDHPTAPLKGGWLVREATINPPLDDEILQEGVEILSRVTDTRGFPPPLVIAAKADQSDATQPTSPAYVSPALLSPHSEITYLASLPPLPFCLSFETWRFHALLDRRWDFGRGTYFLKSSLTFQAMTREAIDVAIFVHTRLLRPVLSMSLLFMSLPLVLGGYGRNMFINLGFALGNSALFYGALLFAQYLGSFKILPPDMTVWAPLMVFGVIASFRWGQIRT
jgi:lipopolysaccharide export system permease protein